MAPSRENPLNQRPAYKKLKSLLAKPGPKTLLWHHSVGKCVEEFCPQDAKRYGSGGLKEHRGVRGRGGVRFRRPDTEEDNLRQLIAESEMWQRRFQDVWFLDDGGICLDVKATPKKLKGLREKAVAILGEMQSSIEECLANQKRQTGKGKKKAGGRVKKRR